MSFIKVENLSKFYMEKKGVFSKSTKTFKAVNKVSFLLKKGETLGIVGESGCGKSTLARMILRLEGIDEGKIIFKNENIVELKGKDLKNLRKDIQIIFQDSYSSLNPRQTVFDIIREPLINFNVGTEKEQFIMVKDIMEKVGLGKEYMNRYPHEFSGGQCQRINIARALILKPEFIVCDEPTSSLDVSIQAQILNLLKELKEELELTYIFISHNLAAVNYISDKIAVMYLGEIVEMFEKKYLETKKHHPYTKTLLEAIPVMNPLEKNHWENILREKKGIKYKVNEDSCSFCIHCTNAKEICYTKKPVIKEIEKGHLIACHCI
ncbi:oligopeptide/dipeptide ABC transporter ATP-binding protein [Clostridium tetanomorphum]|uniref:ABC transporter ATP-binding protein n=1 Tax=Clostridium tetanomorphum TaxID=1553 RepID=A0A923E8Q3_CLOTT|nr:oligopeptide/dipeptide ABC transporter ATP-binding protein [Clostridium tetanomorphum]KAJ53003.1 oligopeptide transport ATP-binding protein AppF [Clostridium tetanomorphum DSM 665]MBC2398535.1 ABC transporter ATP-binding protein [Clostridium tetanomorphum]MBP1864946.1 oligopeptide/dipeptide ABC transporter ATP-binding protein [Clostridium tetanomorphum]NRS83152.1 oligopeptide/dipeptide ABC transporter ATP-binding protein [Clostridium tetanomorphum]NRZ98747.1 oligopeptide/dipeptide ABC trans